MTIRHRLSFHLSSAWLLGALGLGASGCTATATLTPSVTIGPSGCGADSGVSCSTSSTTGYTCTPDSLPTDGDPTLVCGLGTDNGDGTISYCCAASGTSAFGCTADASLSCAGNSTGETCVGGALPDTGTQVCSSGTAMADGSVGYCCAPFTVTANTCAPDASVTGCAFPSFGFSCATGDDPTTYQASLTCSTPTASGSQSLYCCVDTPAAACAADTSVDCSASGTTGYSCTGPAFPTDTDSTLVCSSGTAMADGSAAYCCAAAGTTSFGCSADSTLQCTGSATGQTCTGGATPDTSSQTCSIPQPMADGSDGYCCISFTSTSTSCAPDETVAGCQAGSYGFSCTTGTGDNPMMLDASLTCSTPTRSGSEDLYCCTYN